MSEKFIPSQAKKQYIQKTWNDYLDGRASVGIKTDKYTIRILCTCAW